MYRPRRTLPPLALPILIGIVVGIGFLITNIQPLARPSAQEAVVALPTEAARPLTAAIQPTLTPQPTARLVLPNAGVVAPIIDVYIRNGEWDVGNIGANVGHLFGTAPLGTTGNHGLAGHSELRDGSRGIFAWIQALNYGDPIHIEANGAAYEYQVTGLRRVEPGDLSVLRSSETDRLTLITCDQYDFLRDLYLQRIVVFADRRA
jgi:LPXTG-site transpeptidase (sortase) family protein